MCWRISLLAGYRLLLHLLRKYPGPFFAKLTQIHAGFYAIRRRLHLDIFQYHAQYGRALPCPFRLPAVAHSCTKVGLVLRVGPNRFVFNTIEVQRGTYPNSYSRSRNLRTKEKVDIHQNERFTKAQTYLV